YRGAPVPLARAEAQVFVWPNRQATKMPGPRSPDHKLLNAERRARSRAAGWSSANCAAAADITPSTVLHSPEKRNIAATASANCGLKISDPIARPARKCRSEFIARNPRVKQSSAKPDVCPHKIR